MGTRSRPEFSERAWSLAERFGSHVMAGIMFGGLAGGLLFEHEFHEPFTFALRKLAPVELLLFILGGRLIYRPAVDALGAWGFWWRFLFLAPMLVLFSGAWVATVNGLFPQRDVTMTGTVEGRGKGAGKRRVFLLHVRTSQGTQTFEVRKSEYETARPGDKYIFDGKVGALGLAYRRRFDWLPDTNNQH